MKYWVDLAGEQFDEDNRTGWLQALPVGTYKHPIYGTLNITPDRVKQFAANVKAQVRGTDLDIDYDHKARSGEAAGWVKDAEVRNDGLWVFVEWTTEAAKKIREKAYRYFSPEFVDDWTHPKTGVKHKDVLFGGGLTNRPFLKDILPINLSEVVDDNDNGNEDVMDEATRKQWAKVLGLNPETATEAEVTEALNNYEAPAKLDLSKAKVEKNTDGSVKVTADGADGELIVQPEKVVVSASDPSDEEIKQLAESNPVVAKMLADQKADRQRLRELETANRLSEVNVQLGSIKGLPPVVADKLRVALVTAPRSLSEDFFGAIQKLSEVGFVNTTQQKENDPKKLDDPESPVQQFLSEVDKAMSADKTLSYADAVRMLAETQTDMFNAYEKALEESEVQ